MRESQTGHWWLVPKHQNLSQTLQILRDLNYYKKKIIIMKKTKKQIISIENAFLILTNSKQNRDIAFQICKKQKNKNKGIKSPYPQSQEKNKLLPPHPS